MPNKRIPAMPAMIYIHNGTLYGVSSPGTGSMFTTNCREENERETMSPFSHFVIHPNSDVRFPAFSWNKNSPGYYSTIHRNKSMNFKVAAMA